MDWLAKHFLILLVIIVLFAEENQGRSVREHDFEKNDDSWLPHHTTIAEEIDEINTDAGAKNLIDGDIHVPSTSSEDDGYEEKRNAIRNQAYIWRSREVPYLMDASITNIAASIIGEALDEIQNSTNNCIKFKKLNDESNEHFIKFVRRPGCYSFVGKIPGPHQEISIGQGCEHKGIVLHELMHALGFFHEHTRPDRDKYIRIIYSNIKPGKEINFQIRTVEDVSGLGLPYDYDGIMHYGPYAFAKDTSKPTITKLKDTGGAIGQKKGLSKVDVEQLKALYDCKTDSNTNSWSRWSSWSGCINLKKGRREYSQRFCLRENLAGCAGASKGGTQWRDRACSSTTGAVSKGSESGSTTKIRTTMKTAPAGSTVINEAICGTRSKLLSHPGLVPQNIVGGKTVQPGDWPWQVGFSQAGYVGIFCGGTLINNLWVLSAAHCFLDVSSPSKVEARLGEHNIETNEGTEEIIILEKIIIHAGYDGSTNENDIALVKLSKPVKYTRYIRPACLPDSSKIIKEGQESFVSGWGTTSYGGSSPSVLNVAKVPIVGQTTCKSSVDGIGPTMICAGYASGGIDSCQGDSGGPLVFKNSQDSKYYLCGVVSWGNGCAAPTQYGVYASVTVLRKWIDDALANRVTGRPPKPSKPVFTPTPVVTTKGSVSKGSESGSTTKITTTMKPAPAGSTIINEAICGTRSKLLSHPGLVPQNIVGGKTVQPGDWPWQVGFSQAGYVGLFCGGTLINHLWVLSAAHCFVDVSSPSEVEARLGEHNIETHEGTEEIIILEKIIIHAGYDGSTNENDIALVKLSKPVKYTRYIRPACLPDSSKIIKEGQESFVSGWGTTSYGGSSPSVLNVAKVPIVGQTTCKSSVHGIGPTMICAGYASGGIDSCQGDSGGPLVFKNSQDSKYYLCGVVSWGNGCAAPTQYGVYASVTVLRKWIDDALANRVTGRPPKPSKPVFTPTPVVTTKETISCDFERDSCIWYDEGTDNSNWKRVRMASGIRDHTTEKGYFMAFTPNKAGTNTATMSAWKKISNKTEKCLKIFYQMKGPSKKVLNLFNGYVSYVAKVSEGKDSLWKLMAVPVKAKTNEEEIIFSTYGSIYGNHANDVIAIDDISLIDGPCPVVKIPPTPSILTCAFESNMCYWRQGHNDKFNWIRRKGSTPTSNTGPEYSATGANDFYAYMETSNPRQNRGFATLISPKISSSVPTCLSFKANMYGMNIDVLTVSRVLERSKEQLYKKTGSQGKDWFDVKVDLPSHESFRVEIIGFSDGEKGNIAIDEIRVYLRKCNK